MVECSGRISEVLFARAVSVKTNHKGVVCAGTKPSSSGALDSAGRRLVWAVNRVLECFRGSNDR